MRPENRQASAEIEVTPEMLEAGATALFCGGYEPGENDRETVAKVYRMMEATRSRDDALRRALAMPSRKHKASRLVRKTEAFIREVREIGAEIAALRRDRPPIDPGHSRNR